MIIKFVDASRTLVIEADSVSVGSTIDGGSDVRTHVNGVQTSQYHLPTQFDKAYIMENGKTVDTIYGFKYSTAHSPLPIS